jgi:fermentation-respiration switch protein FrsA (DUF1100 family)
MHSRLPLAGLFCLLLIGSAPATANGSDMKPDKKPEQSVCGFKEPFLFWLWSRMAGRPDTRRLGGLAQVKDLALTTVDGRTLRGYRLGAQSVRGEARTPIGALLVIQGNAILADQLLGEFRPYAEAGYDVYLYDFRGYGRSEGRRRLKAIVSDYRVILARLANDYPRRLVYAMSLGGVIFLDAHDPRHVPQRAVIDSSPARLSGYGCPAEYDPVRHLPTDCRHFMFIAGERDNVVPPAMSAELRERAVGCGARVMVDPDFGHPFMDPDLTIHRRRMQLIADFLLAPQ